MKKILCSAMIILSFMMLLPLAAMKKPAAVSAMSDGVVIPKAEEAVSESFKVLDCETGRITEIKTEDYIFGVVAAEMPALYEEEALKAQAVAAYTYACYRRSQNGDKGYDITNDHTTDQSFTTEEAARERWGGNADKYCEKIRKAVRDTAGYMVTYEGAPALTVYHAISSGRTEACENVWGSSLPYLVPVASVGDKLSPDYLTTAEVSEEKFKAALEGECELSGKPAEYFGEFSRTDSGNVIEAEICGQKLKGSRIRSIFNLRSNDFDAAYKDGKFVFTVRGFGHGVGMSQYGANYLAKQGSGFAEILKAYYTGCDVEKIK